MPKKHPGPQREWIAGRHPVYEALESSDIVRRVLIAEGVKPSEILNKIESVARTKRVPVEIEPRHALDAMTSGANHQGVVAEVAPFAYREASELMDPSRNPHLILVDGVTDPVNIGSILRSAEAFGWNGLLLPRQRAAGITGTVRRVAAGAAEVVPVAQVGSPAEAILRMKRKGLSVVGLDPAGEVSYRDVDLVQPTCLVLGAEGRGLSRLVRDRCDALVSIPMTGRLASINVAVAAAVVMVEVTRDLAARHPVQR